MWSIFELHILEKEIITYMLQSTVMVFIVLDRNGCYETFFRFYLILTSETFYFPTILR